MTEGELRKRVHLDSGTLAPLLKRLEILGYILRTRPEGNERTLSLSLTEAGDELRDEALSVPKAMAGCLDLSPQEMAQLKSLLDKALSRMPRQ